MLQFLNAGFLAGLAAVGLPVLIHFIARRKAERVLFSSVRFLKIIQQQRARNLKIRQILLLVLRCLAVAFTVLAFARPVLHPGSGAAAGTSPAVSAVVLDCSASMGRNALFEKAKIRLRAYGSTLKRRDRTVLFCPGLSNDADSLSGPNESDVFESFSRQSADLKRGDCLAALMRAVSWTERFREPSREIVLIGDMQATGFRGPSDGPAKSDYGGRLLIVPLSAEKENTAITGSGIEDRILEPGKPATVFADIRHFGSRKADDLLIGVYLDGQKVSQKTVSLKPGEKRRFTFRVTPEHRGWTWGRIQIDGDAFEADNAHTFCFRIPETVRVLLVGGTRSDRLPVSSVLSQGISPAGPFRIEEAQAGDRWTDRLATTDVLVLVNCPELPQAGPIPWGKFNQRKRGIFLLFGKDVRPDTEGYRLLEERFGVRFAPPAGRGGFLSFGTVDYAHPIFQGVFEKGKERIQSPRIFRFIPVSGKTLQTVIMMNNGLPLLAESRTDAGDLLVFASGLDDTWSDAAGAAVFAPLVYRSVLYLAGSSEESPAATFVGDPIRFIMPADSLGAEYRVTDPSGESTLLVPNILRGRAVLTLDQIDFPGIYRLYRNGILLNVRAVNLDPMESDFRVLSGGALARFFPNAAIRSIGENFSLPSAVTAARTGKEL
ncbi:MAG TPA: BatA domain-containing protein, partial [bacterium]